MVDTEADLGQGHGLFTGGHGQGHQAVPSHEEDHDLLTEGQGLLADLGHLINDLCPPIKGLCQPEDLGHLANGQEDQDHVEGLCHLDTDQGLLDGQGHLEGQCRLATDQGLPEGQGRLEDQGHLAKGHDHLIEDLDHQEDQNHSEVKLDQGRDHRHLKIKNLQRYLCTVIT